MKRAIVTVVAYAALLYARTVMATPTPQQNCDNLRIKAWKAYTSCVDNAMAKDVKGVAFDEFAAFAKCRHAYAKKWVGFQSKSSLSGSSCRPVGGARFDNSAADGTVTDNLSGLVWELKTALDSTPDPLNPRDGDNFYSWSTGFPYAENGTAYTTFLTGVNGLNTTGFADANGWRLPTLAELQTIVLDFPCTGASGGAKCKCPSTPCVDPALDAANTKDSFYWSSTGYLPNPTSAWYVSFFDGVVVGNFGETNSFWVRAVRGGL